MIGRQVSSNCFLCSFSNSLLKNQRNKKMNSFLMVLKNKMRNRSIRFLNLLKDENQIWSLIFLTKRAILQR